MIQPIFNKFKPLSKTEWSDLEADVRKLAIQLLLGALAVAAALGFFAHLALLGIGPVAGAVTLLLLARGFPARTGTGSAMLERVRGLRLYIATTEAAQIPANQPEGANGSWPFTIARKTTTAGAVPRALCARLKTIFSGRWRR